AMHHELVLLAEFVDAENRNDVLQFAVTLQRALHAAGNVVVPLADVLRIENTARRCERIDRRVNTLLANRTLEVEARGGGTDRGGGRGVGRVVGGRVHCLDRRDGALVGRGDSLLQRAHFGGQRRLVTHGAGHTAEQRAHLATRLGEAEDV